MHRASSSDLSRLFRSLDEIGCARSLSPAGCVPLQMQARGAYHSQPDYFMPFCAGWTDPQTPVHPAVLTSEETLLIEDCRHIVYLSSSRSNEACDVPGKLAANSIPREEHNHHSVEQHQCWNEHRRDPIRCTCCCSITCLETCSRRREVVCFPQR